MVRLAHAHAVVTTAYVDYRTSSHTLQCLELVHNPHTEVGVVNKVGVASKIHSERATPRGHTYKDQGLIDS